jgi:hypothetical protein
MNNKIGRKVSSEALGITQGCPGFAARMSIIDGVSMASKVSA